jgi:hypothetical protein
MSARSVCKNIPKGNLMVQTGMTPAYRSEKSLPFDVIPDGHYKEGVA